MARTGAQFGNNNASNGTQFRDALRKALVNYKTATTKRKKALNHVAKSLISKAIGGDIQAIKEIGDRLDGKPVQAITGPQGEPISLVERVIVVQAIEQSEIIEDQGPGNTIEMVPDHESMTYVRKLEEKQIAEEKPQ